MLRGDRRRGGFGVGRVGRCVDERQPGLGEDFQTHVAALLGAVLEGRKATPSAAGPPCRAAPADKVLGKLSTMRAGNRAGPDDLDGPDMRGSPSADSWLMIGTRRAVP